MSGVVIDASVVIAWLFDDEDEPSADRVFEQIGEAGAFVPPLWHLETRNALLTAERRGRLSWGQVEERLEALKDLPIHTDEALDLQVAFALAKTHKLSFYDAVYLELAKRRNAPLATLDRNLAQAAITEGLGVPG